MSTRPGFAPSPKLLIVVSEDWYFVSHRLAREGFLNLRPISAQWQKLLSGQRNWTYSLWTVLMFQAWLEAQPN